MLLEKINHDMPRIQKNMLKDADRERKMKEKKMEDKTLYKVNEVERHEE